MRIVCLHPILPEDFNPETIRTILNQTQPVDMIIILPNRSTKSSESERLSERALEKEHENGKEVGANNQSDWDDAHVTR